MENEHKYICEECDMTFEKWQSKASHVKYAHGKTKETYNALALAGILKHLDSKLGVKKEFTVICDTCEKPIIVIEREKQHPKKSKYYCNRICANTHKHSEYSKTKASESGKKAWKDGKFDDTVFLQNNKFFVSKAEREILLFLKNRYGDKNAQSQRIKQYYDTRRAVDIFMPNFNAIIEYDGIFHFKEIYKNTFARISKKDANQNRYCKENKIKLIRIKYTVYEKNKIMSLNKIINILENKETDVYLLYNDLDIN